MRVDLKNFTFAKHKEEKPKKGTIVKDTINPKTNKEINMQNMGEILKRDI